MLISGDEIEALVRDPARHQAAKIKVLLAKGQLPVNRQVGPTCGIYALDAAFQVQGQMVAPRKQVFGDWRSQAIGQSSSMRGLAKAQGLSQIGEIGGCADLQALAAGVGIQVTIKRFGSQDELWTLVQDAVNTGHGIVLPYACADNDGGPAWSMNAQGFAHWCLLFGYVEYSYGRVSPKRVFMTTYGNYHEVSPYRLFKADQHIQDWPRQNWIKLTFWAKGPGQPWTIWKRDWQAEQSVADDIRQMANATEAGWGFGIGDSTQVLHKVLDPPNSVPNLNIASTTLQKATLKQADLKKVEYTKTMCGQCVVV
jgi:hypothetical protein